MSNQPEPATPVPASPRDWGPIIHPGFEWVVPPRELWVTPQDPLLDYLRWAWEFPIYLKMLCGLREDEAVLEIGCNHGRTMLGLLGYLRSPGRYEGFDIMKPHIDYANEHLHWSECSVRFQHADVFNALYNPEGKLPPSEFVFPYDDGSFEVAYGASVFTHMLPPDVEHYFHETARVLVGGGRALYSVLVLDNFQGPGTALSPYYDLVHRLPGYEDVAVHDPEDPEFYISYSHARLARMAADAGLTMEIVPGMWSRAHKRGVCQQDLMILEKPGSERAPD